MSTSRSESSGRRPASNIGSGERLAPSVTVPSFDCPVCNRSFTYKSSMIRHSRQCGTKQTQVPGRRKSCQRCAVIKTRCDLRQPHCSRCQAKGVHCQYVIAVPVVKHGRPDKELHDLDCNTGNVLDNENHQSNNPSIPLPGDSFNFPTPSSTVMNTTTDEPPTLSQWGYPLVSDMEPLFDDLHRMGTGIEDYAIMTDGDWLDSLMAGGNSHFRLNDTDINKLSRALRTYPTMMARQEQLPPHIHFWQINQNPIPTPLANCFALTRMWQEKISETESLVIDTIIREIDRLLGEFKSYDEIDLLAALQVLLIYAIMLFSHPASLSKSSSSPFNLQQVANRLVNMGLIDSAEVVHMRPSWEEWIVVSAKRRTILALYAFDSVFSDSTRIERMRCKNLDLMPDSAPKMLWQAPDSRIWEERYDRWLARWKIGGFTQIEFCEKESKHGRVIDERFQMWLEEADEFGAMMLVAMEGTLPALRDSYLLYNISGGSLVRPTFSTGGRLLLLC